MTDTKRMPKPMTEKQILQYLELEARLIVQSELIMSIFHPLNDREYVTKVKFEIGHPGGPQIDIWYHISHWLGDDDDYFSCPEKYLGMTEDELWSEKKHLEEEEKRKRAERAAKAKATREKRRAEKAKKEAEKKDGEKDERYLKYLELKKEFESENKPVKEAVYLCKYWEHDDNDPSGCGETWQWCNNEKSGRRECGCVRTYAMQFCPFYKKGKLAGRWVINDTDKEAAEEFKKQFEGKGTNNDNS